MARQLPMRTHFMGGLTVALASMMAGGLAGTVVAVILAAWIGTPPAPFDSLFGGVFALAGMWAGVLATGSSGDARGR